MVALALPANYRGPSATAVSPDGSIIVGTVATDPQGRQAFRWIENDGILQLGDLPGGRVSSTANDVAADGSVVVGASETFSEPGVGATDEAFYWTPTTGMVNLRDLLIANGATGLDGWTLTEANGVSYDGLTVVGTGVHNGITEAWVATIPEPSTLMLLSLAIVVVVALYLRTGRWCWTAIQNSKEGVERGNVVP
jgi:probable HAF family extracellular repeat protein